MRQRDYNSASFSPNGCGCLVLLILLTPVIGVLVFSTFFACHASKSKQSEAKQYVSSMNKGQQAYYAENGALATSVDALGLGIRTETNNYKYSIRVTQTAAFSYSLPKNQSLKSYFGGVFIVPAQELERNADRNAMTTVTILCKTNGDRPLIRFKPKDEPAEPIYQNGKVICGKGTTELTK